MAREEAFGQVALGVRERVDDPASFARQLRAANLFVEVWVWAMLAAASLWLTTPFPNGSTARPSTKQ